MPKGAASIVLVLVLCPAAWGAEQAATGAEPSEATQPTEPGDDEIIGQFVLVIGGQSTTVGVLEGANLSGLVLAALDNLPEVGLPIAGSPTFNPGSLGILLRALLEQQTSDSFMMAFTPEAMRMDAGGQSMIWTAGSPATMGFADHENGELLPGFPLDRTSSPALMTDNTLGAPVGSTEEEEEEYQETLPTGRSTTVSYVSSFSGSGNNSLSFTIAEANAQEHSVAFDVMMGYPGFRVRQNHDGEVWLAPEIPGQSIIAAFYSNFAGAIANSGWLGDFAGGLTQIMASSRGIPMRGFTVMTTVTRVGGVEVLRQKTAKEFEVGAVWLLPLSRSMLRYISTFREEVALGYEIMDLELTPETYMTGEETQGVAGAIGAGAKMWKDAFKKKFGFGKRKKKDGN